jgi:hypothetical protein
VSAGTTVGLVLALAIVLVPAGVHLGFRAPRIRETGTPGDHGLAFEEVRIPTVRHRTLFGWLLPVPGATRTVVVLHGWGSNAEQMLPIAAPLWRAGLNVLLSDARNHGNCDSDLLTALVIRYAEWVIGHRFEAIAPLNTLCQLACPVLLVHGKDDRTVPSTTRAASWGTAVARRSNFWRSRTRDTTPRTRSNGTPGRSCAFSMRAGRRGHNWVRGLRGEAWSVPLARMAHRQDGQRVLLTR